MWPVAAQEEEASGCRLQLSKRKDFLILSLNCQSTKGCEVVSSLSQEVFEHRVLQWAGSWPGWPLGLFSDPRPVKILQSLIVLR